MLVKNNAAAVMDKPKLGTRGFQRIATNLSPKVRHDKMGDKDYLVVPMVMLTEGVHNGSLGPLLYTKDELAKLPDTWNMKPVVIYHPSGNSACDPLVIDSQGVGVIMNTKIVEEPKGKGKLIKLHAEAWLEESRLKKVDDRVLNALEKGEMMEVSTGLFTENEEIAGEWEGEKYSAIARNFHADHLAILPDQKGACSLEDGAGLLRNEASFDAVRGLLFTALDAKFGQYACYVADVFKEFVVYSKGMKLYKINYSATETSATLEGEPTEVVRVVQYRSPDGSVIANIERSPNVDKKQIVDNLVKNSNGLWTEADRAFLMGKSEAQLMQLTAPTPAPTPAENAAQKAAEKGAEQIKPAMAANSAPVPVPEKEPSVAEYLAKAPAGLRSMLANGLRAHDGRKNELVGAILASPRNAFKKEALEGKDIEELQALVALAGPTQNEQALASYSGLADALQPVGSGAGFHAPVANKEEPLATPVWNFGKDGK